VPVYAIEEIEKNAGKPFDPAFNGIFTELVSKRSPPA